MTRIEVLPTGEKVFYIDVGDIPPHDVEDYIRSVMRNVKEKNDSYFVPVRPSTKEDTFHIQAQWFFIGGIATCVIIFLMDIFGT